MGILPIYWQFVDAIGAFEILAFSYYIFSNIHDFHTRGWTKTTQCISTRYESIVSQAHSITSNCRSGLCYHIKLGTFIWAVTNGHVLQTSLGYYINPLVSILLALIFLKERFNKFEWLAILFAFIGVLYMTLKIGEFPIVSIILALSFGTYGLLKK